MPPSREPSEPPVAEKGLSGESEVRGILLGGLLVLAATSVYWNSLDAPFIFDDFPAVVRNTTIRDLGQLGTVLSPPLDGAGVTGRPLVNLSFAINYALHGLEVRGYHMGSLLLHGFGSLVLFGLLRRSFRLPSLRELWGERASGLAASGALLWSIHPLLTESVTCVAQRNEVLVGVFYFLLFYSFVRSVEGSSSGASARRLWQAVAVSSCWLGMASKEVMATAPVLLLLFDRVFVVGKWAEIWRRRKFMHAAMMTGWLLLACLMVQTDQRAGIVGFGLGMSSWDYLVTQSYALMLYLKLAMWPHPLLVDYGPVTYPLAQVWPEFIAVVLLGLATLWCLWRRPMLGFLGAWFFVILAPSSSIVPLTTQTIAEHRMYLPLLAVVLGVLIGLERLCRPARPWVVGALALMLGLLTVRRNADYGDELHFWQDSIARQPSNARLHASLGYYYLRHQRWLEAIAAYEKAVSLRQNFADAYSDLGTLLLEVGRIDEAVANGRIAARLKPADAAIRFNLGVAFARAGEQRAAVREWEEALRLRPRLGVAHLRLGEAALAAGRPDKAGAHYAQAVATEPTDVEGWAGWGQALLQQNQLEAAAERYQEALKLRPDMAELHYNLGNVWLARERPGEATLSYREALRLQPEFVAASHNLAFALVRLGHPAEAIPYYEQVLRKLPDSALVHRNFALALEQADRLADAIVQNETALRLDPKLVEVREDLERLRRR